MWRLSKRWRDGILWKASVKRPSSQVLTESNAADSSINSIGCVLPLKVMMTLVERVSMKRERVGQKSDGHIPE